MKRPYIIVIAAIIGLTAGMVAAEQSQDNYCDQIEDRVIERGNLDGTFACFSPETTDVRMSEAIANSTELRCVCRHSKNGVVQYIPVSSATGN